MTSIISKRVSEYISIVKYNAALREIAALKAELIKTQEQPLHGSKRLYQNVILDLTHGKYHVVPGNEKDKENIKTLANLAITSYNEQGIFSGRPNEFGNHMETHIKSNGNIKVIKPLTLKGKKQNSGYPDRFIVTPTGHFYLEIKIFGKGKDKDNQRTFFLCNANKITSSCPHYLLGFEHENNTLTGVVKITDMFNKKLKLKCEWNTGNNELYCI